MLIKALIFVLTVNLALYFSATMKSWYRRGKAPFTYKNKLLKINLNGTTVGRNIMLCVITTRKPS